MKPYSRFKKWVRAVLETPPLEYPSLLARRGSTPILICNLPKSASEYIYETLATGLRIPKVTVSTNYFANNLIVRSEFRRLVFFGGVAKDHLPALTQNKLQIRRYLDRMAVHVRDPRQVSLSWLHHLERLFQADDVDTLELFDVELPKDFFDREQNDQIDWMLEYHYPACLRWIEGWLDAEAEEAFTPRMLFTRYEDFRNDREAYFARLLDFFEIDASKFHDPDITPKSSTHHFRKGLVDEWREVFTPAQKERANRLLSDRIRERFGYES